MQKMKEFYFTKNDDFSGLVDWPWFFSRLSPLAQRFLKKNDCVVEEVEYFVPSYIGRSVVYYSLYIHDDAEPYGYKMICFGVSLTKLNEVLEDLWAINDYQRNYTLRF